LEARGRRSTSRLLDLRCSAGSGRDLPLPPTVGGSRPRGYDVRKLPACPSSAAIPAGPPPGWPRAWVVPEGAGPESEDPSSGANPRREALQRQPVRRSGYRLPVRRSFYPRFPSCLRHREAAGAAAAGLPQPGGVGPAASPVSGRPALVGGPPPHPGGAEPGFPRSVKDPMGVDSPGRATGRGPGAGLAFPGVALQRVLVPRRASPDAWEAIPGWSRISGAQVAAEEEGRWERCRNPPGFHSRRASCRLRGTSSPPRSPMSPWRSPMSPSRSPMSPPRPGSRLVGVPGEAAPQETPVPLPGPTRGALLRRRPSRRSWCRRRGLSPLRGRREVRWEFPPSPARPPPPAFLGSWLPEEVEALEAEFRQAGGGRRPSGWKGAAALRPRRPGRRP
jgi:hypothetical protein